MLDKFVGKIAEELKLAPREVTAVLTLLEGGATVPFIARYRKEATGSLDEVAITAIRQRLAQLQELDARREAILKSLQERNLLTDELKKQIDEAETLTTLEDIYLPFRPKRRTRATIAKELADKSFGALEARMADAMSRPESRSSFDMAAAEALDTAMVDGRTAGGAA
mgnify:CR=1 FL=1